jgi:2'-5' RNA ligase
VAWRDPIVGGERGLRAVPAASLHVTLCFLGWRAAAELDAIASACDIASECGAAMLSAEEPVWLPPRRPRVLALKLGDQDGRLAAVQTELSRTLADGGWYVPEQRPFLAHVTMARVARGARVQAGELPGVAIEPFRGATVTLFRSRLSSAGARYEPLKSVALRP